MIIRYVGIQKSTHFWKNVQNTTSKETLRPLNCPFGFFDLTIKYCWLSFRNRYWIKIDCKTSCEKCIRARTTMKSIKLSPRTSKDESSTWRLEDDTDPGRAVWTLIKQKQMSTVKYDGWCRPCDSLIKLWGVEKLWGFNNIFICLGH